jgi:hypothetical protein
METCGMLLAFPVTATACTVYSALTIYVLSRWRPLRLFLTAGSVCVLVLCVVEAVILWRNGVLGARGKLGPSFETLHAIVFFLTPPAVANLVVFLPNPPSRDLLIVAVATFIVAIALVFWNISVQQTLYGPDGTGGPYSTTFVTPNRAIPLPTGS